MKSIITKVARYENEVTYLAGCNQKGLGTM